MHYYQIYFLNKVDKEEVFLLNVHFHNFEHLILMYNSFLVNSYYV